MSAGYLAKCRGKQRHQTQEEAERHRARLVRAGIWNAAISNTYLCNQCGYWHAGRLGGANRGKGRGAPKNTKKFLPSQ